MILILRYRNDRQGVRYDNPPDRDLRPLLHRSISAKLFAKILTMPAACANFILKTFVKTLQIRHQVWFEPDMEHPKLRMQSDAAFLFFPQICKRLHN